MYDIARCAPAQRPAARQENQPTGLRRARLLHACRSEGALVQAMALLEAPFVKDTNKSVGAHIKEQISVIGENIQARLPAMRPGWLIDMLSTACMRRQPARQAGPWPRPASDKPVPASTGV